jgi:energy-coupling factor transport system ATP-binding protein
MPVAMMIAENITYQYPGNGECVIADFSAQFKRGEVVAVRGKNGSGKTTLTKLLVGILRPAKGRVMVDGIDTASLSLFEIGRKVGYIFQNPNSQLFCDSVYNEVAYGLNNLGLDKELIEEKTGYYLDYFGLSRYRDDYPGNLSLGEKQRLALAAVLALGSDYLVLDESTTGLDVYWRREFGDLLLSLRRDMGYGIVLVSHEAGFIARCADRELVMAR